jgi:hypothetical protein
MKEGDDTVNKVLHPTAFGKIWHATLGDMLSHKILHGHKVHAFVPEEVKRALPQSIYRPKSRLSHPLKLK